MISTDPDKMFWNCVWKFAATCYFGCYPWFLCDVTIVTWYFFFLKGNWFMTSVIKMYMYILNKNWIIVRVYIRFNETKSRGYGNFIHPCACYAIGRRGALQRMIYELKSNAPFLTVTFAFWDFQITRDENWSNFTFNGDLKIKHIINRLLFVLDKYMPIFHGDVVLGHCLLSRDRNSCWLSVIQLLLE